MLTMALSVFWLAILWTYTELLPRPFDDWKNTLLYMGAGILIIASSIATKRSRVRQRDCHDASPCEGPRSDIVFNGILISYLIICIASIVVAPSGQYEGLLELARLILWAGLAWVFAQCSSRTWLWLMRMTVVSAALIAFLTWRQLHGSTIWPYETPWLTPIGHITYYGDFMAMSWVMAMGLMCHSVILRASPGGSKKKILNAVQDNNLGKLAFYILCIFLIDVGVALAATRASMAGIVAGLMLAIPLIGYATRSFKKTAIIILIGAINLAIIFFMPIKSMRGASAGERIRQTASITQTSVEVVSSGRWHTYVTSAHIAMERPLIGWGLGSFRFVYPEFAHRDTQDSLVSSKVWYMHPHNELLHQSSELGFPGAFLFLLGFLYLLYKGIRALRRSCQCGGGFTPGSPPKDKCHCGDDSVFLITALCGITAAFVSWQFSTNFLFPVARLMTALFGGIILNGIAQSRSLTAFRMTKSEGLRVTGCKAFRMTVMGGVILSTLLLASYQLSLVYINKRHAASSNESARHYTRWAVTLAPGAFDPMFALAGISLRAATPSQAAPAIEALYTRYPYVPAVLYMMGVIRAHQGNIPEARRLLQHAIKNDPTNDAAKELLDRLPPTH